MSGSIISFLEWALILMRGDGRWNRTCWVLVIGIVAGCLWEFLMGYEGSITD